MSTYTFLEKIVNKPPAFDKYIRDNVAWVSNFLGISTDPLIVNVGRELTHEEQLQLTTLVNNYIDPVVFLVYDHSDTLTMHSHYTSDVDNILVDSKAILQTFIYNNPGANNGLVLDSVKTIVEYACPNVQNFANTTSGSIWLDIFDVTRNVSICNVTKDLNEVATKWNALAATGSTEANSVFTSVQFDGMMNKTPNYDVIWQLRGTTSNSNYTFRCNCLQYLFYNVE